MPSPGYIRRGFLQESSLANVPLICLSYFGSAAAHAHIRFISRRLHRKQEGVQIVLCCWDAPNRGSTLSEISDFPSAFSFASSLHDVIAAVLKFAQSGANAPSYDAANKREIKAAP
jgi:hypothetical protein